MIQTVHSLLGHKNENTFYRKNVEYTSRVQQVLHIYLYLLLFFVYYLMEYEYII